MGAGVRGNSMLRVEYAAFRTRILEYAWYIETDGLKISKRDYQWIGNLNFTEHG